MITKLPTKLSRAINFNAFSLPTPKYEDTGATCYQIGKIQKRGGGIINNGLVGRAERFIMRHPFYTKKAGKDPCSQP